MNDTATTVLSAFTAGCDAVDELVQNAIPPEPEKRKAVLKALELLAEGIADVVELAEAAEVPEAPELYRLGGAALDKIRDYAERCR